ncbi:MAG TPA: UDP-N-acetylmuramoyl-tripeptide--D-alanyl-D-alanine ligase [Candidatus Acidoferrum sp.]|nr:UDP-N-acetylmuramoyl-tripeptide--D-alanyl-D-alanine ligase [Candidatus Acidoferrum sp.]
MEPRPLHYIAQAVAGELRHGPPGATVSRVCTDSRRAGPEDLFFALAGARFDAHRFLPEVARRGVGAIVAERDKLPADFCQCAVIAVGSTRRALGQLGARYRRDFDLPVIAVGGSNGKTTTKELIASVLREQRAVLWSEASFNNEIGVPLTLLRLERNHQAAVLEAGSNHPGELAPLVQMIAPSHGVVTNIGREHLQFFGDLAGVAREEGTMAEGLSASGTLFINGDDGWSESILPRTSARVIRAGLKEGNDYQAVDIRSDDRGSVFWVRCRQARLEGRYRIQLLGRHQVANALFALAVGAELELDRAPIERGLAACAPCQMRLQLWQAGGVRVLDDAYNANADSMLAALETLRALPGRGRRIAVLGDMAELGESSAPAHAEVGRRAAELGLDQLFAVGTRAAEMAASARRAGLRNVVEFLDVEDAAQAVNDFARPGDAVLVKASRAMRLERITETLRKIRTKNEE